MKILFLLSTNVWFDHLSGEQEVKAFKLGFSLLGIQCDFAGIDADDFATYDVYVVFSMSTDVLEKIKYIETNKKVIVVPQTEDYSDATSEQLASYCSRIQDAYIVVRNEKEEQFFLAEWPKRKQIDIKGWFIEPFVWNEEASSAALYCPDQNYILSFVGDAIDDQSLSFFRNVESSFKRVVVCSQRCTDKYFHDVEDDSIELRGLVKYGAIEWFCLLSNATYYYESNPRLTSALLESLWLGREVISPHYKMMNAILGMPLVVENEFELSGLSVKEKRDCVRPFRVEKIAQNVIKQIGTGGVCAHNG